MQKVISKKIVQADYEGGSTGDLLTDEYFRSILKNRNRYSPDQDYGIYTKKKTILTSPGMGSNDRPSVAGQDSHRDENESNRESLSSGYNDGGQADDESGPGNKSIAPDPYAGMLMNNELFMEHFVEQSDKDKSIKGHLRKLLKGPSVSTPHRRHSVD